MSFLNLGPRALQIGSVEVIGLDMVLRNVTANAAIINAGSFHVDRIPTLDAAKIGSGSFPVARGGTGVASLAAGNLPVGAGTGAEREP